jgi:lipid-A-disaccharide synthase
MGGPQLAEAGVEIVVDQRELAVGGIFEILTSLPRLIRARRRMLDCVRREKPDLAVLVDSGGFNLPLARDVKRIGGTPILYYVAPQIWAWRRRRLRKLAARTDRIAVILPFERDYYAARGVEVDFVGHPVLDRLRPPVREGGPARSVDGIEEAPRPDRRALRARLGITRDAPVLAIFPGSRRNELERNLPVQVEAFLQLRAADPTLHAIVGLAPSLEAEAVRRILSAVRAELPDALHVIQGETDAVISAADLAVAKPGTVTVELMLRGCPMVVTGRAHPGSAWLAARWIDVEWLAMPNLVAGEPIVPELLQTDARPDRIAAALAPLFEGPERDRQIEALKEASRRLGGPGAAQRASEIVEEMLASDRA